MNYLTEYYKNQCSSLQERFNFLQETLVNIREDISDMSDAQIEEWIKGQDTGNMDASQSDSMREMMKRKRAKDRAARGGTKAPKGESKGPSAEAPKPPPSGSAGSAGTKPPPSGSAGSGYDPYREYNQRARERADQRARERASREEARAAKGEPKGPGPAPEAPTGAGRGVNSTASTVGRVVKGGAKQAAKIVTIPAEVIGSTLKSLNPVKKVPGGVGVNWGGVRNIGGFGAGIGGMIGAEAAMDAVGIKDQSWADYVRTPVSYAAGGAADVAGTALLGGALPTAGALGAAAAQGAGIGAAAIGGYKLGEYIGDKTGFHDWLGNKIGGGAALNTAKTGLRGGVPSINIKNDAEDAEEEAKLKRARDIEAKANQMAGKSKSTPVPAGQMEYDDDKLPDEFFSSPEEAAAYRNQRAK